MAKVDNNFLAPRETFFGYLQELLNPKVLLPCFKDGIPLIIISSLEQGTTCVHGLEPNILGVNRPLFHLHVIRVFLKVLLKEARRHGNGARQGEI
jgi:hypothetical protein